MERRDIRPFPRSWGTDIEYDMYPPNTRDGMVEQLDKLSMVYPECEEGCEMEAGPQYINQDKNSPAPTTQKMNPESLHEYEMVNHPAHYNKHPSGIECIEVVRWFNFNIGNAIKYCWRNGLKNGSIEKQIEDLEKAIFYLEDEIKRLNGEVANR